MSTRQRMRASVAGFLIVCVASIAGQQALDDRQRREAVDHFKAGMQALTAERFDVAESEFRQATRLDPLYDAAFYGLGQVYMATKRYEDALQAYLRAREAFKTATAADLLDRVAADRRLKDQIQAIRDYVSLYERQASTTRSPTVAAVIDRYRDQIRQMESRLSRNNSGAPSPVPAGFSLAIGSAYFRLNQLPEAEREYLAAIEVNRSFGEAFNNLAVVYLVTGRVREAREAVESAERAGFRVNPQLKADIKNKGKSEW
jgi:tetratricopeptide (TPR) repeat protein